MKYGYSEASWKDNKLFIRGKNTGVSLIPHAEHPEMYWVSWSDGSLGDFYNLTRAKNIAVKAVITVWNNTLDMQLEGRTQPQRGAWDQFKL